MKKIKRKMLASLVMVLLTLFSIQSLAHHGHQHSRQNIIDEVANFFGVASESVGDLLARVFADLGVPNAYIKGEEGGAAFGIGVTYGSGHLLYRNTHRKVYWQGPSFGPDFGADGSKVFMLVYKLKNVRDIYQAYPAIKGSLYFVAGIGLGLNYRSSDDSDVLLVPIRAGVGWRQGINVNYIKITRQRDWFPF